MLSTLTAASAASVALSLSDGTPVEFVKITRKDNIQVRVPSTHFLGNEDQLRIFRRDGSHYKDETELTLVATPRASASVDTETGPFYVEGLTTAFSTKAAALDRARQRVLGSRGASLDVYVRTVVATVPKPR